MTLANKKAFWREITAQKTFQLLGTLYDILRRRDLSASAFLSDNFSCEGHIERSDGEQRVCEEVGPEGRTRQRKVEAALAQTGAQAVRGQQQPIKKIVTFFDQLGR